MLILRSLNKCPILGLAINGKKKTRFCTATNKQTRQFQNTLYDWGNSSNRLYTISTTTENFNQYHDNWPKSHRKIRLYNFKIENTIYKIKKEIFLKILHLLSYCVNVPPILQNVSTNTLNIEKNSVTPHTSSMPPLLKLLCQHYFKNVSIDTLKRACNTYSFIVIYRYVCVLVSCIFFLKCNKCANLSWLLNDT